jgi:hypothetical protein
VFGVGIVGGRLARELVSGNPEVQLDLHSSRESRRGELGRVFADRIDKGMVTVSGMHEDPTPGVRVVVLTGDQPSQVDAASAHLAAGRHVVTTVDSYECARQLWDLDDLARNKGTTLVVGACFSPGLTDLLTAYGSTRMDSVEEVHFARHGASGPQCAADRLAALRRPAHEWRDGRWVTHRGGTGRQLCWFPDPVGGRDAYFADTAEPLVTLARMGDLLRCSARLVLSRRDRFAQHLPRMLPAPVEGGVGAVRVEMRGTSGDEQVTLVFGALDRPGVAAGVLASEVVLAILGGEAPVGVIGAGSVADPRALLRRLRSKGVRVAELGGPTALGDPANSSHH